MIALIQRVSSGKVLIEKKLYSEIKQGFVILLGIFEDDDQTDIKKTYR